jgi:methyltransferase (TIGR00027 family)
LWGVAEPESTAVRVALWRVLHVEVDPPPHVLVDKVGLELVGPDEGWRSRPDMHPEGTRPFRVAIIARARFVEDLVAEQEAKGVDQYVLLGAGLDTFAQRGADMAAQLRVFEIDQPDPQLWKRERLMALGYGIPEWLRFVPVDFEAGASWWDELIAAGFDPERPAVVACTGVSMYLTKDAITEMLRCIAGLAAGSTLAMTFMVPFDMLDEEDRAGIRMAEEGARRSGTPWISFYRPDEILALMHEAGFREATHVPAKEVADRYFEGRIEGLRSSSGEDFLLART